MNHKVYVALNSVSIFCKQFEIWWKCSIALVRALSLTFLSLSPASVMYSCTRPPTHSVKPCVKKLFGNDQGKQTSWFLPILSQLGNGRMGKDFNLGHMIVFSTAYTLYQVFVVRLRRMFLTSGFPESFFFQCKCDNLFVMGCQTEALIRM